jgi:hypothetical protein
VPAAAIEVGNGLGGQFEMVGEEHQGRLIQ